MESNNNSIAYYPTQDEDKSWIVLGQKSGEPPIVAHKGSFETKKEAEVIAKKLRSVTMEQKLKGGGRIDLSEFETDNPKLFQCLHSVREFVANNSTVTDSYVDRHNGNYLVHFKDAHPYLEGLVKPTLTSMTYCEPYMHLEKVEVAKNHIKVPLKDFSSYAEGEGVRKKGDVDAKDETEYSCDNESCRKYYYGEYNSGYCSAECKNSYEDGGQTHTMPDGSTMLNSEHYAKGGSMAEGGEIEADLKSIKNKYPNAKVSYYFAKNNNGKSYVVTAKEKGKIVYSSYKQPYADGGGVGIDGMNNSEMFRCFTALEDDLRKSEFAIEDKIIDSQRNLVVYFRSSGDFSDVEKHKLEKFLSKYTDERVKPDFCKVFKRFEIKGHQILSYTKTDIYAEGGEIGFTFRYEPYNMYAPKERGFTTPPNIDVIDIGVEAKNEDLALKKANKILLKDYPNLKESGVILNSHLRHRTDRDSTTFADGGSMARGGEIKVGDEVGLRFDSEYHKDNLDNFIVEKIENDTYSVRGKKNDNTYSVPREEIIVYRSGSTYQGGGEIKKRKGIKSDVFYVSNSDERSIELKPYNNNLVDKIYVYSNSVVFYKNGNPIDRILNISMDSNEELATDIENRLSTFAKGGSTYQGGGEILIVKTKKGLKTMKDFEDFSKDEIKEWGTERGWKYNAKGEKLGGQALKLDEFFVKARSRYNTKLPLSTYAEGGQILSFSFNTDNVSQKEIVEIVENYTKDWRTSGDISNVNMFVTLPKSKANELALDLKGEDVYDIERKESRYSKGGSTYEDGGEIGEIESIEKYFDKAKSRSDIDKKREWEVYTEDLFLEHSGDQDSGTKEVFWDDIPKAKMIEAIDFGNSLIGRPPYKKGGSTYAEGGAIEVVGETDKSEHKGGAHILTAVEFVEMLNVSKLPTEAKKTVEELLKILKEEGDNVSVTNKHYENLRVVISDKFPEALIEVSDPEEVEPTNDELKQLVKGLKAQIKYADTAAEKKELRQLLRGLSAMIS